MTVINYVDTDANQFASISDVIDGDLFTPYLLSDLTIGGISAQDWVVVTYDDSDWGIAFGGYNFVTDSNGVMQMGTITALVEGPMDGNTLNAVGSFSDFTIDTALLVQALNSPEYTDEYDILMGLFESDDQITLKFDGVYMNGYKGNDTIRTGRYDDSLMGGVGNDKIFASAGDDVLDGGFGNDKLDGGKGADHLFGSKGKDTIKLGNDQDRDTVHYGNANESTGNKFDRVKQFDNGEDVFDFRGMDGDTDTNDFDALVFSDVAAANALWVDNSGKHAWVYADVDGDASADLKIKVFKQDIVEGDFLFDYN
ncbi:calcium-binding protein [Marivivens aquimaris]|uniref:calcium-binding protein n=1 Tax=Marivivens aquimaris TaxID=2774876 RepID=UPI00187FF641|nr:M10 family metallopeptidase C-terminal domain-containing protein [Marivivens aquimaris]